MPVQLFLDKSECCGCTACKSICPVSAITMKVDDEGFEYPDVNPELCIECGLCRKVCDFKDARNNLQKDPVSIYALKHLDDGIRRRSTSGGAFIALSDIFIDGGGVVYGAADDRRLTTRHMRAVAARERNRCCGSKYVQSSLSDTYLDVKNDLAAGRKVCFTGTPCQTAGLRRFIEMSGVGGGGLYTADLICHGVPSPLLFKDYIAFCEVSSGKRVKSYFHRPKDTFGWSHNSKIVYEDNTCSEGSPLSNTWRTLFYSNLALRQSCYACKYASVKRCGDLTLADFWGIEHSMPEFKDDLGVSLVFANNAKGLVLLDKMKNSAILEKSSLADCVPYQPNLRCPKACNDADRKTFWKLYHEQGFPAIAKKYGGYGTTASVKRLASRILTKMHLIDRARKMKNFIKFKKY